MFIDIYCDGSVIKNPGGVGAWCAIIVVNDRWRILEDYDLDTTNNRMELQAAIEGLRYLRFGKQVRLFSDSEYVIKGFTEGRVDKWAANNWTRKTRKKAHDVAAKGGYATGYEGGVEQIPNADLWRELADQDLAHEVEWTYHPGQHDEPTTLSGPDFYMAMAHQFALSRARLVHAARERGFAIPDIPQTVEERTEITERIRSHVSPPDPPDVKRPEVYGVFQYRKHDSKSYSGPKFLPVSPSELPDGGRAACEKAAATMNRTDETEEMKKFRVKYRDRYFVKPYSVTVKSKGVELGQSVEEVVND